MFAHFGRLGRPRATRLALASLGPVLALILISIGSGLFFDTRLPEDLTRMGWGTWLRLVLGVIHLVGGAALLAPSLTVPASLLLGLITSGIAGYLLAVGQGVLSIAPAITAVVLLAYGLGSWLRRRAAVTSWHRMILRYGEETDAPAIPEPDSSSLSPNLQPRLR